MMADCIDEAKLDYEDKKKDSYIDKYDNFSHRNGLAWEDMVYTYFNDTKNSQVLPPALSYERPQLHQALS